ncbi:MAG: putative 2OG-Fe(II) oxygenase [Rhizomicrobium sp.]
MTGRFASHVQARLALLRHAAAQQPASVALRTQLADTLADAGEYDEFAALFRASYAETPLRGLLLGSLADNAPRDSVEKVHARAAALVARGMGYAPVIAALAVCEALLGRPEETRRLVDYERFLRVAPMAPPEGYGDAAFREALAADVRSKLEYTDPNARNTGNAWFHNGLTASERPAARAFTSAATRAVERYVAALPADDTHPFLRARPERFFLRGWGVVARSDGHFETHVHPHAWLSGVYYVSQPKASLDGPRGWLRVGPPSRYAIGDAWPERMVSPTAGCLVLMPGYFFHGTVPLGADEERISIAFDVVPSEFATSASQYG